MKWVASGWLLFRKSCKTGRLSSGPPQGLAISFIAWRHTALPFAFLSGCGLVYGAADVCVGPPQLEHSLQLKPSAEAWSALGVHFAKEKQFNCAFQAFESSLKLSPDSWLTHYNYALALAAGAHRDREIAELRKTVRLNPEFAGGHVALGEALRSRGSLDEAEREFHAALGIDPKSVPAANGLASMFIVQKRFSAAIPWLQELVKLDPSVPRHELDLGVAWAESGAYEQSREILQSLLAAHPEISEAHYNLGVAMAKEDNYRGAVTEFQACLSRDPRSDEARMAIAVALHKVADENEALPYVEDYLKRHPNDARGLSLLGSIYRLTGQDEQAEKILRRAVELLPDNADVRLDLGITLKNRHMLDLARIQLEKARALSPRSEEVHFQLASVYKSLNHVESWQREIDELQSLKLRKLQVDIGTTTAARANQFLVSGDARGASELYRQALKADPDDAKTWYNLSLALKSARDVLGEWDALQRSIKLDGSLAAARNGMGVLCMERGELDHAAREFLAAIAADPQAAEPRHNLGYLYATQGRNAAAEPLFRQATENDQSYVEAWRMLANVIAAQGRFGEAEKPAEMAAKLAPKNTAVMTMLGMIRVRLGRGEDALPLFREVVALEPAQASAHLNLGIALADTLSPEAAILEFTEAARLAPEDAAAHYNLGRALFDVQRYDEAQTELDRTVQLDPRNDSAMYLVALIERQRGNPAAAVQPLKTALSIEPSNADARFLLGRCFHELDQNDLAIAEWRIALQLKPDHKEAAYNLARALESRAPEEARALRESIQGKQKRQMEIDRASTLGNFALTSADERDWPGAIAHFKEALEVCGSCSLQAQLRKDLGLTYARCGNLRDAVAELGRAKALAPGDPDITKALRVIRASHEQPAVAVP